MSPDIGLRPSAGIPREVHVMYRTICVAVDHSPQARGAAEMALALAEVFDARLTAVHVDATPSRALRRERLLEVLPQGYAPAQPGADPAPADAPGVLQWLVDECAGRKVTCAVRRLEGSPVEALSDELGSHGHDLLVLGATGDGGGDGRSIGSVAERLARRGGADAVVVKGDGPAPGAPRSIVAAIDGSPRSYAALLSAIELARRVPGATVEAVAVYDPYLHYTLFNGIVDVLSEKASKVFKFKDQEKLHEEIIDTGLAKIYQAHLEVARSVARDEGVEIKITLLDGKAHQKVRAHCQKLRPWLVVMGRTGVHSDGEMDIGATSENLLRCLDSSVLLASRSHVPPIDVRAHESVEWSPEAVEKMERVPPFVRGVARTAVVRWAIERGHSIITPSVINSCMGDILPRSAAQAMGYVAEELAKATDDLETGKTFICGECGHAARDHRPVTCPVCKTGSEGFQEIDRTALEGLGTVEPGAVEETFDGRRLHWTQEAKAALHRVPAGYERRRTRARVEKTAKVRGLETVSEEFVIDMIQQEVADSSYLSDRGESLKVEFSKQERPDDATPRERPESPLPWTDAAWARIGRVPEGFMRDMTRERVEQFATDKGLAHVDLTLCEEGIAEGRRMMAEMLGQYGKGTSGKEALRKELGGRTTAAGEPDPAPPAGNAG